jgi:hypothetical protein
MRPRRSVLARPTATVEEALEHARRPRAGPRVLEAGLGIDPEFIDVDTGRGQAGDDRDDLLERLLVSDLRGGSSRPPSRVARVAVRTRSDGLAGVRELAVGIDAPGHAGTVP